MAAMPPMPPATLPHFPVADGTDQLVALVQEEHDAAAAGGQPPALYGAKITGGGCGGERMLLTAAAAAGRCCLSEASPDLYSYLPRLQAQWASWQWRASAAWRQCGGWCRCVPTQLQGCVAWRRLPHCHCLPRPMIRAAPGPLQRYTEESGHTPKVFSGFSSGAAAFGHLRLRRSGTAAGTAAGAAAS